MQQNPDVAVLGLGAMGHAFAANLLKNAFRVYGWNRTRCRGEDLLSHGLLLTEKPQDAAAQADIVLLMLADANATAQVVEKIQQTLKPGAVVCQMGTIGVEATEKLIARLNESRPDVTVIDAPVSGTKAPAENAQIVVLASGNAQCRADLKKVFNAISKKTVWLGRAGNGSRMKLVINAWLIGAMHTLAESLHIADELGFTPNDVWQVLEGGPLAMPYAKNKLEKITANDYSPQMHFCWALKDANLALEAAKKSHLPVLQCIADTWLEAVNHGLGQQDISVIYQFLNEAEKA